MSTRLSIAASLWFICAACKTAQPLTPEGISAAEAARQDAGQLSSKAAMQPPTAAASPAASRDAGHAAAPQADARASGDAAAGSATDAAVTGSEPHCLPARDLPVEGGKLDVAGKQRSFEVHAPSELPRDHAAPLLIDLHGLMTHARYQRANSGFAAEADRAGFIVVYPQALNNAWNLAAADCCSAETDIDDLEFIRALVTELKLSACIDPQRVYVAGSDVGGGLAQQLACRASELFAGVVTRDFGLPELAAVSCKPSRALSVLALRSESDPDHPYAGGEVRLSSGLNTRLSMLSAVASLERWAELNECSGEPDTSTLNCRRFSHCKDATEVTLCTGENRSAAEDAAAAWGFLKRF